MPTIGRLLTAMVTPFTKDGDVDYSRAGDLAKKIILDGSDGLVIGGTTGEAPAMSDEEKLNLYSAVKDSVGVNGVVIAGTTDSNAAVLSVDVEDNDGITVLGSTIVLKRFVKNPIKEPVLSYELITA